MSAPNSGMQVEKVLDDLIYRLTNTEASPEVRAALVEARRLKSVTTRWAAIPPPPDARREMLARVMDLISSVGAPEPRMTSKPPPPRSAPPPRPTRPSSNRNERDTPVADAALPRDALPSSHGEEPRRKVTPPPLPFRARPTGDIPSPSRAETRDDMRRHSGPPLAEQRSADEQRSNLGSQGGLRAASAPTAAARSAAPTRRPPPPRSTKPPPPRAKLPHPDDRDSVEPAFEPQSVPVIERERSSAPPISKPLSLRPPSPQVEARPPTRLTPTHPQPFTRTQSALPGPEHVSSLPPIRAVATERGEGLEGLSSSISSSQRKAVEQHRRASEPNRPKPRTPTVAFGVVRQPEPPVREVSASVAEGVSVVRPEATEWQPHPIAMGASVKLLYHNNQTGQYTALVRLAPGSTFPSRRHAKLEEMYLVSGAAVAGTVDMRVGDYSRAEEGSIHPPIRSENGCTFLISGSEHDEMLSEGSA